MKKAVFVAVILVFFTSTALALKVDDPAPPFALRDNTGATFFLSDYVGSKKKIPRKGAIINFFGSYCKPCRHELPILNSLADEFGKKGIKVVVIGFNLARPDQTTGVPDSAIPSGRSARSG